MRDFALGVLGGCMTHQPNIPKSELYHRRLARRLADGGRARLLIRIARDFEQEYRLRLDNLREEHALDGVLVHVRSVFTRKAPMVTTLVSASGVRYYLHPFLFRPWQSGWAKVENADFAGCRLILHRKRPVAAPAADQPAPPRAVPGDMPADGDMADIVPGATRVAGIALRDLFYLAGAFTGTQAWAIRDELRMVNEVRARCQELRLPMFVLGPSRRPDNYWLDRLCRKLDTRLSRRLRGWSVPYCSLPEAQDAQGAKLYRPDGFHLTAAGHGYVAERLAGMLEPWLDQQARPR